MDPKNIESISDFFKNRDLKYFESTETNRVINDFYHETGFKVKSSSDMKALIQGKNSIIGSNIEKKKSNGTYAYSTTESESPKPRIEYYGDFDIKAHDEKVRIKNQKDTELLESLRPKGSPTLREQMDADIAAGRNIAPGASSSKIEEPLQQTDDTEYPLQEDMPVPSYDTSDPYGVYKHSILNDLDLPEDTPERSYSEGMTEWMGSKDYEEWVKKTYNEYYDSQENPHYQEPVDFRKQNQGTRVYDYSTNISNTNDGIVPIEEKNSWKVVQELARDLRERQRSTSVNDAFAFITADFLDTKNFMGAGKSEADVKIELEKRLLNKGFTIEEAEFMKDALVIKNSLGAAITVSLSYGNDNNNLIDRAPEMIMTGSTILEPSAKENVYMFNEAEKLKEWLRKNTISLSSSYRLDFKKNPIEGMRTVYNDILNVGVKKIVDGEYIDVSDYSQILEKIKKTSDKIDQLTRISTNENLYRSSKVGAAYPTSFSSFETRSELERLKELKTTYNKMKLDIVGRRARYSQTVAELIQESGGVKSVFMLKGVLGKETLNKLSGYGIDTKDLRLDALKINGTSVSFNELYHLITDWKTRSAFKSGDMSLKITDDEDLGVLRPIVQEAISLLERQSRGYPAMIGSTLAASSLEVFSNVQRTLDDVSLLMVQGAYELSGQMDKEKERSFELMNDFYSIKHKAELDFAKEVRAYGPEISGDITDSSSFGELLFKGTKAAADSLPITLTYLLAPEVGLAMTGLSSYGKNLKELEDIRRYISLTGDPAGLYEIEDLTLGRARMIAASKAVGETALTYAFTYNMLKNISTSASALSGMSVLEAKEAINFYSKSFANNFAKMSGVSTLTEYKEESLIAFHNMFVDEIYGLADYTFKDYAETLSNVALTTPFTTVPLTGVAYSRMSKASKATVHSLLARTMWDDKMYSAISEFREIENKIEKDKKDGKSPNESLAKRHKELAKEIAKTNDRIVAGIEANATVDQIVELSSNMNRMEEIASTLRRESESEGSDQKTKKDDLLEKELERLWERNQEILTLIDKKKLNEAISETHSKVLTKAYNSGDLSEEESKEVDAIIKYNEKAVGENTGKQLTDSERGISNIIKENVERGKMSEEQGAKAIESITDKTPIDVSDMSWESDPNLSDNEKSYKKLAQTIKYSTISKRTDPAKVRELSEFFFTLSDADTNHFTESAKRELFEILSNEKSTKTLDKFYNKIVAAQEIVNEIIKANPSTELIIPLKGAEQIFTGKLKNGQVLYNIAGVNHAISMLMKNDRMAAPFRKVSNRLDSVLSGIIFDTNNYEMSFAELDFLEQDLSQFDKPQIEQKKDAVAIRNERALSQRGLQTKPGKVSDSRKKQFHSVESKIERLMYAMLRRYEVDQTPGIFGPTNQIEAFLSMKKVLEDNYQKLRKFDKSKKGRERAAAWKSVYDRIVRMSENIQDVESNMNPDNIKGVQWMSKMFEGVRDSSIKHSIEYYGSNPKVYENYLPFFYSKQIDGKIKDYYDGEGEMKGPSTMQETYDPLSITETERLIIPDEWHDRVFRAYSNTRMEVEARSDLDTYEGVINNKSLSSIYDTDYRSKLGLSGKETDYYKVIALLQEKADKINKIIKTTGPEAGEFELAKEFYNAIISGVSARKLATLPMRPSQGYSALFAVSPLLSTRANEMLGGFILKFTAGNLDASQKSNQGLQNVLLHSSTLIRSGLDALPIGYKNQFDREISTNIIKQSVGKVIDLANKQSTFFLEKMLGESDGIAGRASFASLYYERMLQMQPSKDIDGKKLKDLTFDEFWEWSADPENVDRDAVAWADSQIDRAQIIALPWNQGDLFNRRTLSSTLFPFGRFAYNRRAGMANDWAILMDKQTSTPADKAKAKRRLASAVVEIGVFKYIMPLYGAAFAKVLVPMFAEMVGWEDEYSEAAEMVKNFMSSITPKGEYKRIMNFETTKYKQNQQKVFKTSIAEGMIPLPTPSFANELLLSGVNYAAKSTKLTNEDVFTIYSQETKNLFDPDKEFDLKNWVMENTGMMGMVLDDAEKIIGAVDYLNMKSPSKFGDKNISPKADFAAKAYFFGRIISAYAPSGDLDRGLNKLKSVLDNYYTSTKKVKPREGF